MPGSTRPTGGDLPMSARTLVATVAAAALALGSLAGCTGSGTTPAGSHPAAEKNPLATLVADVTGTLRKVANSSDTVSSVGFTMTMTAGAVKASGSGVIDFEPLALEVTLDPSKAGATTLRLVHGVLYLKLPAAERSGLGGKSWLKLDPGKDSPFSSLNRQVQDLNPVQNAKTLLASGK